MSAVAAWSHITGGRRGMDITARTESAVTQWAPHASATAISHSLKALEKLKVRRTVFATASSRCAELHSGATSLPT